MALSVEVLGLMAGSSVLSAAVTGFATVLASRPRPKTKPERDLDVVKVLEAVVEQLREENERLIGRADAVSADAHRVRNKLSKVLAYVQLVVGPYIATLHRQIIALGGRPEEMPPLPDLSDEPAPPAAATPAA